MGRKKPEPLFPDDNTILIIGQTKQTEASALPEGPEKQKLQKEANAYLTLANARGWVNGLKAPT
jgi:hypothetical protein